jgi:acyl-CoA reductase-like NAD-dependent aldehyde dehydrogenase
VRANAGPYGLSAAVHTRDRNRIASAPDRLATGVVGVNRRGDAVEQEPPFGGLGASGNGYPEGGEFVYSSLTSLQACYGQELP